MKNVIVILLALLLTVACLEVFVRILRPDGAERLPAFIVDVDAGWSRPPNQHGFIIQRLPGIFRTHFQTNSRGMRDRELPAEKSGKLRVLCLGDSVTEGWGVEEDETYPKILETQFLRDVEVWNMGVVGYSTDQELQQLRRVIDNTRPDIVTLAFYFNDLPENSVTSARWPPNYAKPYFEVHNGQLALTNSEQLRRQKVEADRRAISIRARASTAVSGLALYRLTRYAWRTARDSSRGSRNRPQPGTRDRSPEWWGIDNLYRTSQSEELNQAWNLTESLLAELNRLCQSHGATLILLYVPAPMDGIPGMMQTQLRLMGINEPSTSFDIGVIEGRLAQISGRNGMRFVSLGGRFRSAADPTGLFLPQAPRDVHIGRNGHRLVARVLAEYLQRQGLIPPQNLRPGGF